jgi:cobalamin biosynthesis Mg chelatase CobN
MRRRYITASIGLFFIFLYCSSCTITKNLKKDKTEKDTKIEKDSTATVKTDTDTKVTEVIDTTVLIPGSELSGNTGKLDKPFVIENEDAVTTVTKDSSGYNVKTIVKPKKLKVQKKKTTVSKSTSVAKVSEKSKEKVSEQKKESSKEVKKTGIPWWWILVLLGALIAIYFFRKIYFFTRQGKV